MGVLSLRVVIAVDLLRIRGSWLLNLICLHCIKEVTRAKLRLFLIGVIFIHLRRFSILPMVLMNFSTWAYHTPIATHLVRLFI